MVGLGAPEVPVAQAALEVRVGWEEHAGVITPAEAGMVDQDVQEVRPARAVAAAEGRQSRFCSLAESRLLRGPILILSAWAAQVAHRLELSIAIRVLTESRSQS